ncbi:MAG: bifunctional folylpolyglutamate synthase/dihydrofolate synthase [Kaiparowitsia implicata GSE-PSE-MK54-09C]|jgi:dihydrofolate synthase/folylpolyglutamate synthase|nr:bifunctional folylpolyglutamate synthase/dihydrofolate synthase [Kaiparowitsia implicata GSE-PSE-MK54-09C]
MNRPDADIPLGSPTDASPDAALNALLNGFTHFGVELGLVRIQRLLGALGDPHLQVPIVHVAGSNGKGSVCAYVSSVLTHAGYRVGRYTSPHLVSWRERICLNDQPIDPATLLDLLTQVTAAIDPQQPSPTQFEVITAAAWLYFARQQVDVAVMEVGLGGRLDATNVCDRPLVSVITSLSREHWQRLGPTLTHIAREKAGILKPGCSAVIAPQVPEADAVLRERLAELHCPAVWAEPAIARGEDWAEVGETLQVPLVLPGAHQLTNVAVAIAALHALRQRGFDLTDQQIAAGLGKTQWPGRMQWVSWGDRALLVDGAHNEAGAQALRQYVDTAIRVTRPVGWVLGMIANKDHAAIFRHLLRSGDRLVLVPVPDHLSADVGDLAVLARQVCPTLADCTTEANGTAGINVALQQAGASTVILAGSLYLIGDVFRRAQLLPQ